MFINSFLFSWNKGIYFLYNKIDAITILENIKGICQYYFPKTLQIETYVKENENDSSVHSQTIFHYLINESQRKTIDIFC